MTPAGSSPRVRGRPYENGGVALLEGLIPASAGQTSRAISGARTVRAHPRECGADVSAPRAGAGVLWLIPASAGQTTFCGRPTFLPWAHPRECGADAAHLPGMDVGAGSSPRVRGRRLFGSAPHPVAGLIPASAGQTDTLRSPQPHSRAHPRECGADARTSQGSIHRQGSSPRVRGRPNSQASRILTHGLIPASAGQTAWA